MEPSFKSSLLASGVGEAVVKVLTEQKVLSPRVFRVMKEEHIVRQLQCGGMPIGGHALLWQMWEKESTQAPSELEYTAAHALICMRCYQCKTKSQINVCLSAVYST